MARFTVQRRFPASLRVRVDEDGAAVMLGGSEQIYLQVASVQVDRRDEKPAGGWGNDVLISEQFSVAVTHESRPLQQTDEVLLDPRD